MPKEFVMQSTACEHTVLKGLQQGPHKSVEIPSIQVFGSRVDPPRRASGPKSVIVRTTCGALRGPFCDHFFATILTSVLDSFGGRLRLLWAAFWGVESSQVGTKCVLKHIFVCENVDVHEINLKPLENTLF